MKTVKSALSALWQFFFPLIVDPSAVNLQAYGLGLMSWALLATKAPAWLLGECLALMLADKALAAWVSVKGAQSPK